MVKPHIRLSDYAKTSAIAGLTAGAFAYGTLTMITVEKAQVDIDASISTQISDISKELYKEIPSPDGKTKPPAIADIVAKYTSDSPDTSIYATGSYDAGYCLAGFNEKGDESPDGIVMTASISSVQEGHILKESSCPASSAEMNLITGPGDNKLAGGEEYKKPLVNDESTSMVAFLIAAGGGISSFIRLTFPAKRREYTLSDAKKITPTPKVSTTQSIPDAVQPTPRVSEKNDSSRDYTSELFSRYESIKAEWATYELDILKVLEYPSITDMSIASTGEFHKALYVAGLHAPKSPSPLAERELWRFENTVVDLEHKFRLMLNEAKRLKWSSYNEQERASLRTAQNLLAIAMNSASSANERKIAYKRLIKEVEGILVLPEKAMMELEAKTLPALDALVYKETTHS